MKPIVPLFFFISVACSAQNFKMSPGLWEIGTVIKNPDGTIINPAKAMEDAMAKVPPEQRKMVMEMMAKNGNRMGDSGVKVCYTEKMISNPESLTEAEKKDCDSEITSQSSDRMEMTFKCKDGVTGSGNWTVKNSTSYESVVSMNDPKKGKTVMTSKGRFISKECGNVKPHKS